MKTPCSQPNQRPVLCRGYVRLALVILTFVILVTVPFAKAYDLSHDRSQSLYTNIDSPTAPTIKPINFCHSSKS